jgi:hypothetical protein
MQFFCFFYLHFVAPYQGVLLSYILPVELVHTAGPSLSQSSVSDPSVKDGVCFTTKEGIKIYVYCAGIRHLEVDVLVNAANKDLLME